jgi:hypothetical protein
VRQYVTERSDRIAMLAWLDGVDASERAREAALEVAAGVAAQLTLRGAGLDLLMVDDRALRVEPRTGRNALDLVLDRLAVHRLAEAEAVVEAVLAAHESALSTLVLITADEGPRRHALVSSLVRRGLPVRWVSIVEGDEAAKVAPEETKGAPMTRLSVADVERGHRDHRRRAIPTRRAS